MMSAVKKAPKLVKSGLTRYSVARWLYEWPSAARHPDLLDA